MIGSCGWYIKALFPFRSWMEEKDAKQKKKKETERERVLDAHMTLKKC